MLIDLFNDPAFWEMVIAVMVGYIFVKAIPYLLVAGAYVLAGIAYVVGLIVGVAIGIVGVIVLAVRDAWKGSK